MLQGKMAKIVSNKKQLKRLVELMVENQDIAKGICSKSASQRKWTQLSIELNSLGPPQREWKKWHRVWVDLKCKIKKKKTEISATRSGPKRLHHFSDMEEAVIQLMEFNTCINSTGREFGCKDEDHDVSTNTVDDAIDNISRESVEEQHKKKRKANIMEEWKHIFEEQTAAQKEFYQQMTSLVSDMEKTMRNIEDYSKKSSQQRDEILKLKKEKLKAYKVSKENERLDRKAILELKIQMLELEKKKQDLMEYI